MQGNSLLSVGLFPNYHGGEMEKVHIHDEGAGFVTQAFVDRFDNHTAIRTVVVKGMARTSTVQHGPGKKTRFARSSSKRVERDRPVL